jgi:ABC-type nickel/cobalt efflux system permease component RcnA
MMQPAQSSTSNERSGIQQKGATDINNEIDNDDHNNDIDNDIHLQHQHQQAHGHAHGTGTSVGDMDRSKCILFVWLLMMLK